MCPSNFRQKFDRFRTFITGRGRGHQLALNARASPSSVDPSLTQNTTASPSSVDPSSTQNAPSPSSVDPSSTQNAPSPSSVDPSSTQNAPSPASVDPSSTQNAPSPSSVDPLLRKKFNRFRILIIGRANAGKTTILQRVCGTQENPEIYNSAGEKIDPAVLMASRKRGEHDIENEMVFSSNKGFVFHDSRGFEAGGQSEFDKVKAFIADRSKRTSLKDRIHVIWYCIPMDEASRSFTEGEHKFFSHCDTGSIPVIVLFTKFDALHTVEFAQLKRNGESRKDAKEQAPKRAEESFANGSQLKFLYNPKEIGRPPRCHVCLPNMDKDGADCKPLIQRTAETLDDKVLQQLFVSTQQTNLELCMKYAVERTLAELVDSTVPSDISECFPMVIGKLGAWFPHIWAGNREREDTYNDRGDVRDNLGFDTTDNNHPVYTQMQSQLLSLASGSSSLEQIVQLSSATVIILERSFHIWDQRLHLDDWQMTRVSVRDAVEEYMMPPHAAAIRQAVGTAVQIYQAQLSTGMVTPPSEGSERKAEFIDTILQLTLKHRLPRLS